MRYSRTPQRGQVESLVHPKRVVPATVEIVDIAGLVKGASKGEGLGNQFLANIRETDAILHVLRCFDDPNVTHVDGSVDPVRDKEIIDLELQLKDLETVESRLGKLQKQATGGDKHAKKACEVLVRYREALLAGRSARTVALDGPEEEKIAHEFFLLTAKPVLYVCNVDEASAAGGNAYVDRVREAVAGENAGVLVIAAKIESEIAEFESYDERQMFLEELGLEHSGIERLVRAAYDLLGLRTYFTAGEPEVRAWTINKGDKAPRAAGVIQPRRRQARRPRQGLRRRGRRHHALPLQRVATSAPPTPSEGVVEIPVPPSEGVQFSSVFASPSEGAQSPLALCSACARVFVSIRLFPPSEGVQFSRIFASPSEGPQIPNRLQTFCRSLCAVYDILPIRRCRAKWPFSTTF